MLVMAYGSELLSRFAKRYEIFVSLAYGGLYARTKGNWKS